MLFANIKPSEDDLTRDPMRGSRGLERQWQAWRLLSGAKALDIGDDIVDLASRKIEIRHGRMWRVEKGSLHSRQSSVCPKVRGRIP